ncbi:hypothetical protein D3C81_1552410 [compost metagenome]
MQFIGDLHARGTGTHHQHRAFRQLLRVAVSGRVHLLHARRLHGNRRDHRALERAGGDHHLLRFDHPVAGLHSETRAIAVAHHLGDIDAGADRRVERAGVGFEVIGNLVLAGEGVRVQAFEFQAREAVVPGRAVGDQRIPAASAPGFGNALALQHQVRHAQAAQVFTHGHTGLPGANYKRIDFGFIGCHVCALLSCPTRMAVGGCRSHSGSARENAKL